MDSQELVQLMNQIEEKGIPWETVEKTAKVSRPLMNLYARSGPVPVTLIKSLKKVLEQPSA